MTEAKLTRKEAAAICWQSVQDLEYVILALDGSDDDALKAAYTKALANLDATCAIQIEGLTR